jgi:amidohydrolase
MIKEGVLDSPKVDMCLAMHVWNEKPVGWLGIAKGQLWQELGNSGSS